MSLQAIAGVAYDRRNPQGPTLIARTRAARQAETLSPMPQTEAAAKARQVNGALETLKRYIPTEFLALYLPFLALVQDAGPAMRAWAPYVYLGFLVATPFAVLLIFLAKAAEEGGDRSIANWPYFEAGLATASFAVWGACVPGMFPGNQIWLAMLAMASAFVLPLIDTAFSGKAGSSKGAIDGAGPKPGRAVEGLEVLEGLDDSPPLAGRRGLP